jgi:hypothetical protein
MIEYFTDTVVTDTSAFRIFQDMRGAQLAYKITPQSTTVLTQTLLAPDDPRYVDEAFVENINALVTPNLAANIWGVMTINGERIMYRELIPNLGGTSGTVRGMMRGTAGTAATEHPVDSTIYNMGRDNLLPRNLQNYIVSSSSLGDGVQTVFVAPNIYLG